MERRVAAPSTRPAEPGRRGVQTWIMLALILLLAALLRFNELDVPSFKVFDEDYYATDACAYIAEGQFLCGDEKTAFVHPPVGKWLIAAGIWMFTPTAFGSRVVVATSGTLSIALLFLLARRLLRSTAGAAIAAGLFAVDFLHLVTSRLALLEVFGSFFVLAAFLCYLIDRDQRARGPSSEPKQEVWHRRDVLWTRFGSRWRVLTGIMLGLAIGSKWTMAPVLPAIGALVLVDARRRDREAPTRIPVGRTILSEMPSIIVTLVLLPALVYAMSFVGRIDGSLLAFPWSEGSWYRTLVDRQVAMFEYHLDLRRHFAGPRAPFHSSPPWSWPLIQRPIPLAFAVRDGAYREILALGNPLVWWPALGAIVWMVVSALRTGRNRSSAIVLGAGLAGTYLYWLLLGPGLTNVYIYYFVAAVPFLCLALGAVGAQLLTQRRGVVIVASYLVLVAASFVFFYPVLTWKPLSPEQWRSRIPFSQCAPYDIGNKEVVAGYPFPVDDPFGFPIPSYPDGIPDEEHVPLLTTRDGWCWR